MYKDSDLFLHHILVTQVSQSEFKGTLASLIAACCMLSLFSDGYTKKESEGVQMAQSNTTSYNIPTMMKILVKEKAPLQFSTVPYPVIH